MKYNDIKDQMKTGDIILFGGQYKFSKMIELFTGSQFSHVGMVVRLDDYSEPLLWEATTLSNLKDIISDDTIEGPKLVDLHDRLADYGKEVVPYEAPTFAYHPLLLDRDGSMSKEVITLHNELHGHKECSTELMTWDFIKGRFFNIEVPKDEVFCSELIALTYMRLGLIAHKHPYNAYLPRDFEEHRKYLKLLKGSFGKQVTLEM